ncbi:MAG: rRNA pseudouridine synthase [Pseudomonadales bacterium]|nr:rRNA pseudouridine synthase [Pseudomonadales bacterium]
MRLDKYLALAAGLTRSQARRVVHSGRVSVAGVRQKDTGAACQSGDEVQLDGELLILPAEHRYYMLNKPAGLITSTQDGGYGTVMSCLPDELRDGLMPVGRLDKETTGLLLLTTDGAWSQRMRKPGVHSKVYRITLDQPCTEDMLKAWLQGVSLRGDEQPGRALAVECLNSHEVRMTVDEGRYHLVRRMCAAVGNHVKALHREQVAGICLDAALSVGSWRELDEAEVHVVGS